MNRPIIHTDPPQLASKFTKQDRPIRAASTKADERIKRLVESRKMYGGVKKKTSTPNENPAPVAARRRSDRIRALPVPKAAIVKPVVVRRPSLTTSKKRRSSGVKKNVRRSGVLPKPAVRSIKQQVKPEPLPSSSSCTSSDSDLGLGCSNATQTAKTNRPSTVPAKQTTITDIDPQQFQPASTFDFNSLENERQQSNSTRMSIMNVNIFDPAARAAFIHQRNEVRRRESVAFLKTISEPNPTRSSIRQRINPSARTTKIQFADHPKINRISEVAESEEVFKNRCQVRSANVGFEQPLHSSTPSRLNRGCESTIAESPMYNADENNIQPKKLNFDLSLPESPPVLNERLTSSSGPSTEVGELYQVLRPFLMSFKRLTVDECERLVAKITNEEKTALKTLARLLD
ncbi:hypothetical protein M3Y94_00251400 [Aphelenchoides besseyi]|nr:hypothetical protein M3Y94_00251400 [Aphelenchoides besseyi]KAI6236250.1 hypothetical protein M3Y95_00137500 [Aphelenchoides besseyi]